MLQMEVVGVRVEMPSNQPIVLLKETQGERYLPIWIGMTEATAIAMAQAEEPPPGRSPTTCSGTCSTPSAWDCGQ
nr:hypothetical protein GCM10020093_015660 [Planobispora longispora]